MNTTEQYIYLLIPSERSTTTVVQSSVHKLIVCLCVCVCVFVFVYVFVKLMKSCECVCDQYSHSMAYSVQFSRFKRLARVLFMFEPFNVKLPKTNRSRAIDFV